MYKHDYVYVYMYACISAHLRAQTYICMYVCICVCIITNERNSDKVWNICSLGYSGILGSSHSTFQKKEKYRDSSQSSFLAHAAIPWVCDRNWTWI